MNSSGRTRARRGEINFLVRSMRLHPRIRESCVTSIAVAKHLTPTPTDTYTHTHIRSHTLLLLPLKGQAGRNTLLMRCSFCHWAQCSTQTHSVVLYYQETNNFASFQIQSREQRGGVPKFSTFINSDSVWERGETLFNKEGKHASTKHNLILCERERM